MCTRLRINHFQMSHINVNECDKKTSDKLLIKKYVYNLKKKMFKMHVPNS